FIFEAAAKYCVDIATHQHGCCVLQRCINHSSGKHQEILVLEISANGLLLAQNAFGNYAVQSILELQIPSSVSMLLSQFEGNYVHLATQKVSSHVVEKCLSVLDGHARSMIIRELLSATLFEQVLQDPQANYVVQTALRVAEVDLQITLLHVERCMDDAFEVRFAEKEPGECEGIVMVFGVVRIALERRGDGGIVPLPEGMSSPLYTIWGSLQDKPWGISSVLLSATCHSKDSGPQQGLPNMSFDMPASLEYLSGLARAISAEDELVDLVKTFLIPANLHPRLPDPALTMDRLPNDTIGVYSEFLRFFGVRIRFSTFPLSVLKAIPDHLTWRHSHSCVSDDLPIDGYDQNDVERLCARVIRFREMKEEVLLCSGLSYVWLNKKYDLVFRKKVDDADAKIVEELHHLPISLLDRVSKHTTAPSAEGVTISLPTPDEVVAA
ncbi:putative pumilio homolog 8, chloroplastic, partial [Tanacetum coccineum]